MKKRELIEQIVNRMELAHPVITIDTARLPSKGSDKFPSWFWETVKNYGYTTSWTGDTLILKFEEF